jgi:hypothetical protein
MNTIVAKQLRSGDEPINEGSHDRESCHTKPRALNNL